MTRSYFALFALSLLGSCVYHRHERELPPQHDSPPELETEAEADHPLRNFSIGFHLGWRQLDDDDFWDPVDEHFLIGAEFVFEPEESPVGWEMGFAASGWTEDDEGPDDLDINGSLGEFYGGVRKTFDAGSFKPYIGGGLSLFSAEYRAEEDFQGGDRILRDDDSGVGGYLRAGIVWPLNERLHLGFDYRVMSGSDIDFFRDEGEADFGQLSLVLLTSF